MMRFANSVVFYPWLIGFALLGGLSPTVSAEPHRYALVVGVRSYPAAENLPTLNYTEADAHRVAEVLGAGGFDVTLMTQSHSRATKQDGLAPNAAFIRKQFSLLAKTPGLQADDLLVVVLNGHGIGLQSRANRKNVTFYFCPADASLQGLEYSEDVEQRQKNPEEFEQTNLIPIQELYQTLNQSAAGVKLLILDACRNDPTQEKLFRSANSVTRPPLPKPPKTMVAMFSCSAGQKAMEDPDLKHGVFTHFLLEAMTGKADANQDQRITIAELYDYVSRNTASFVRKKRSRAQMPEMVGSLQGGVPIARLKAERSPSEKKPEKGKNLAQTPADNTKKTRTLKEVASKGRSLSVTLDLSETGSITDVYDSHRGDSTKEVGLKDGAEVLVLSYDERSGRTQIQFVHKSKKITGWIEFGQKILVSPLTKQPATAVSP